MQKRCRARLHCERLLFLLLAATVTSAFATPAFSQSLNYFTGVRTDMPYQLMLGSAPSPKPADLCAAGSKADHCYTDSTKSERKKFVQDFKDPGHYREMQPGDEKLIEDQIKSRQQVPREIFRLGH